MADEKTLLNNNEDNDEVALNSTAKDEDSDFVDLSLAFSDDEDDIDDVEDETDDYEYRPKPSLLKGFSLRKKKKEDTEEKEEEIEENQHKEMEILAQPEVAEDFPIVENEIVEKNTEEDVIVETVEVEEPQAGNDFAVSISDAEEDEEIVEEKPEKEKKFKGFSFFAKKTKEPEIFTEDVVEETEKFEELPPFEEDAEVVEETETLEELTPFEENAEVVEEVEEFEELTPFAENTDVEVAPADTTVEAEEQPEAKKEKKARKKKEKAVKESVEEHSDESSVPIITTKDHLTFILIIVALLLTIAFIWIKFIPFGNDTQNIGGTTNVGEKVSVIQLQREKAAGHFIQSDIESVFYTVSPDYKVAYYQCNNGKMNSIESAGTVSATAKIGAETLPIRVDYIQVDGKIFGVGVFRSADNQGSFYHEMVVFKLTNLPKGYEQDGKALLLATSNEEALAQKCNVWTESFIVDLKSGRTQRFLSTDNNVYSTGYAILTDEGYLTSNGKIPFFTTRMYDAAVNKKDIYLKDNRQEKPFATDVTGSFMYVDGDSVSYLKSNDNGFNVVKNENGKELVLFSLSYDTSYLYYNEYLLDKYSGTLYNVRTGRQLELNEYGMSNAEMMTVTDDGKYLVVLGTVDNALDYQVHIFELNSKRCAKYEDDNFSQHKNLALVDNTTIVYSVVEPSQGYEYVSLDISKAF